jgi:hypothetical protein
MAEITFNDTFGKAIMDVMIRYQFQTVLELGSFDGDGSTQIFIQALKKARQPRMVCLEASQDRFQNLLKNTAGFPWIECVNMSSISLENFSLSNFDTDVWNTRFNKLKYPKEEVRNWWLNDLEFLRKAGAGYLDNSVDRFDVVLLDSGEFCSYDEFRLVSNKVHCIILDDVFSAFKNNRVHHELLANDSWRLVWEDQKVRHGASIFVKKEFKPKILGIFRKFIGL